MKQTFLFFLIVVTACTTKSETSTENPKTKNEANVQLQTEKPIQKMEEVVEEQEKPELTLYLNGIYEYDYPYDTKDMNENQYVAFRKNGDTVDAWYFGTSDEFDEAREGYLPGYFVSKIQSLSNKGDSIFFSVLTANNQCYTKRPPIGIVDKTELDKSFEKWNDYGEIQTIDYAGKLDGLKLYISMFGETRTYKKTRDYFHPDIDNYDPTKCQTAPLLQIDQNIDNLTEEMVLDFLSTFSVICEANVEFGQWGNELLFKILSTNPELALKVFSNSLSELDTTSIYEELESPLHDLIPIDSIISKIEPLEIDEQLKKSVLERLESLK
jgi:hypothetical protein